MKQLFFFSNNKNKITEVGKIFQNKNIKILSFKDLNIYDEPEETGKTFEENAKIKSDYGFSKTGIPCFADDSGICIESLGWSPGVYSRRYIETFKNNKNCFRQIIKSVNRSGKEKAYFKTSISLSINYDKNIVFNGKIYGKISNIIKGNNGFGYDPIFIPRHFNKTLAELNIKEKNKISHRSEAVTKLINFLFN